MQNSQNTDSVFFLPVENYVLSFFEAAQAWANAFALPA
jgi:hypothetical protein